MEVAISRVHFPVTALGPGRRVGLWFQGCSIRCPGCVSVDTWQAGVGLVPIGELIGRLATLAPVAGGLTISGGEPFDQPDALVLVATAWRSMSAKSVLVFTGREHADVEPWLGANPGLVDALITGPFRSDLPQQLALRGSDNQQLHVLTPAGEEFRVFERPRRAEDRKLDVMFDEDGSAWLAGIPDRGDLSRLRRALAAQGHRAETSDRRGLPAR